MKRVNDYLKDLGLSERERRVYLACVKLGETSVPKISKQIKLSRDSVYQALDELKKLGLIDYDLKKYGRKVYTKNPNSVLELIKRRERRLKKIELGFKDLLPEIRQEFKDQKGPKFKYFETTDEIRKAEFAAAKAKDKNMRILSAAFSIEVMGGVNYLNKLNEELAQNGVKQKLIRSYLTEVLEIKNKYKGYKYYNYTPAGLEREVRVAPSELDFESTMMIYDNNILVVGKEDDKFAFVINSVAYSGMMKKFFDFVWRFCKPLNLKK